MLSFILVLLWLGVVLLLSWLLFPTVCLFFAASDVKSTSSLSYFGLLLLLLLFDFLILVFFGLMLLAMVARDVDDGGHDVAVY